MSIDENCFIKKIDNNQSTKQNFDLIYSVLKNLIGANIAKRTFMPKPEKGADEVIIECFEKISSFTNDFAHYRSIEKILEEYKADMRNKILVTIDIHFSDNENTYCSDKYDSLTVEKICYMITKFIEYGNFTEIIRFIKEEGAAISSKEYREIVNIHNIYESIKKSLGLIETKVIKEYETTTYRLFHSIWYPSKTMRASSFYRSLFENPDDVKDYSHK